MATGEHRHEIRTFNINTVIDHEFEMFHISDNDNRRVKKCQMVLFGVANAASAKVYVRKQFGDARWKEQQEKE